MGVARRGVQGAEGGGGSRTTTYSVSHDWLPHLEHDVVSTIGEIFAAG
ncbi:MAG TPA: hypothetical protein VGJ12_11595 [Gemmatimonadaceae bacterium]